MGTVPGGRAFRKVVKENEAVRLGPHPDGCPWKKRDCGPTERCQACVCVHGGQALEGTVRRWPLRPEDRGLRRRQFCWDLDLELPDSRMMRNTLLLVKPPACGSL